MSELAVAPTRKHHQFGPSRMGYLDQCAAFTSNPGTNEAAEEGTFLHDVMDKMLQQVIKGRAATTREQVEGWVSKSYELADGQKDALSFCCAKLDKFLAKKPAQILCEIDVQVTRANGRNLNHGFLDVLFIFANGMGILVDFKFGYGAVPSAANNLQGFNYALGALQKFPGLKGIGICFIQPRLGSISEHFLSRADMPATLARLEQVIDRALAVQADPANAHTFLKPGTYCGYCALAGTCTSLANHRGIAASRLRDLPQPPSFKGLELRRPEDLALARYWVDIIETGLKEVKARAYEVAEANGGELRCTLPDGTEILYEMQERGMDRSLGSAIEVAEALKEFVTPEEVLGAAELAIGKLETISKNALVEVAAARGEKLSKKAAWEQVSGTLEALGLLSRPEGKIRFLKLRKNEPKQIVNKE